MSKRTRPDQRQVLLMGAAVAISIIGSLMHNAREFGFPSVLRSENGEFPSVVVSLIVFLVWWRVGGMRTLAAWTLVALAMLHLIVGAIMTVIPFGFLPFEPEQTWEHYLSHIIYGVAQLPAIVLGLRDAMARRLSLEPRAGVSS